MRALKASAGPAAAKDPISEQAQEQLHVLAVSDIQIQIPAELEPGWNYTDPLPPPPATLPPDTPYAWSSSGKQRNWSRATEGKQVL